MAGNGAGAAASGAYGWGSVGTGIKADSDPLYPAHIDSLSYACCPFVPGDIPGRGDKSSQKRNLSDYGNGHSSQLLTVLENGYGQKKEAEEGVMRPDIFYCCERG